MPSALETLPTGDQELGADANELSGKRLAEVVMTMARAKYSSDESSTLFRGVSGGHWGCALGARARCMPVFSSQNQDSSTRAYILNFEDPTESATAGLVRRGVMSSPGDAAK